MDYMRSVYETDRFFTFPQFQRTADYLAATLKELGLRDVEILAAPADGVTRYGFWTMPLAWDAKSARLEIADPAVAEDVRVLADYPAIPASLGMWSGSTPPEGITAEVVEMATPDTLPDMRGKFVLTHFNLLSQTYALKWLLVKHGALGVINAHTENPQLEDDRHWVNFWGDNGWPFTKRDAPLPCFSVTPRQSRFLHELLERNGRLRVHAKVDSRYYDGTYPYVTAVIPGTSGEEEVLELGHTSEQGANDNAAGVAAMLEAAGTLNRLIASGALPRPRRGIRILAMGEMFPTMHYVANHAERLRNTIAALCLDTPAGPYEMAGTEYWFHLNPDISRSFADALVLRVAGEYFPALNPPRHFRAEPYATGTDNFLADPAIGVPTIWPFSGTGVHTHHNTADKPQGVDSRSLRDLAVVTAAFLYYVAAAGEAELPWIAEVAATRASEQLIGRNSRALEQAFAANTAAELGAALGRGLEVNEYMLERESQSIASAVRVVPRGKRPQAQAAVEPVLHRLRRLAQDESDRLRAAVMTRAAQLGIAGEIRPAAPKHPQAEEASRIVIRRKRPGTIPMDDLPAERWEGYPYGSWELVPVTALYWCDGKRNLAEVIRLTGLEHDTAGFDFTGYFRFLAKNGYVEIV